MKTIFKLCLAFSVLTISTSVSAQFYSFQTKNLKLIYYSKAHEFIVPHLARCFENAYLFHRNLFDYSSNDQVTVFLQDFGDFGNGGAMPIPKNLITIHLAPFAYVYETLPANERMNWMMNHEVAHIISTDNPSRSDSFYRALFAGKVLPVPEQPVTMLYSYLTNPRLYSGRWYLEGLAVFLETWMAGGLGRALGAYDEMVFRTKVRDGAYIYDLVGLESEGTTVDFQTSTNSYLYGTRFLSYIAYTYGPEKVIEWGSRSKGSKGFFSSQFKKVFGISLDMAWSQWIEWEHGWQKANLDSIRVNPTTPFRPVLNNALGSVSRAFYNKAEKKIYVAIRYPGQIAQIAAINLDTGEMNKITNIRGAAKFFVSSLAYDHKGGRIFYTTDNSHLRDLNVVDIKTAKSRLLIKDARVGDLAFNQVDGSIWGVRHFNGISTLVRIPYPYREWNQIYSFDYGNDIFDIDISPQGDVITSALVDVSGRQKLIKMDASGLINGKTQYEVVYDFENSVPANFTFTDDGRYLYGSSYYSGVSNIYRYDFEKEDMDILSNCETGFFRPVPISDDSLIVFRYTGKGFVPVTIPIQIPENVGAINFLGTAIAEKYPLVKSWVLDSPTRINLDSLGAYSRPYNSISNMSLGSIYPVIEGYKDYAGVGMRLNFVDRLGLSGFDLTTSYTPDQALPQDQGFHLNFNFHHWQWRLNATYNKADFYDLFGPTKNSRKGYSVSIEHTKSLLFEDPKSFELTTKLSGYGGLEILPEFQNTRASFEEAVSFELGLNYKHLRESLGAVEEEMGVRYKLTSFNNYVNSEFFPRVYGELDYGTLLPIDHSSIWLRGSAGYSFGNRDEPFANFFFGGFGNNWVDHLDANRYRDYHSFPGFSLKDFDFSFPSGTNFGKVMGEWTLPPVRFRRFGISSLYLRWMRLSLFSTGLVTNFDDSAIRGEYGAAGAQLNFRIILFSHLKSTFSLGYAIAAKKNRQPSDEFMLSLKIL